MKPTFRSLFAGLIFFALPPGAAWTQADLPTEASALEFEFDVMVAELEKPLETLNGHYLKRLDSVEKSLQSEGDLDGVLAMMKEREAIEKTGRPVVDPPDEEPEALRESREIYRQSRVSIEKQIERNIVPERDRLLRKLGKLEDQYTRRGELEPALAIKQVIEEVLDQTDNAPASKRGESRAVKRDGSIEFKVQVDGVTFLKIRGDEIWFDHSKGRFKKPGLHLGEYPTYLNGTTEWFPVWEGNVTEPHDADVGLPAETPMPPLRIRNGGGRGYAEIVEQPAEENDFTATIALKDEKKDGTGFNASDWIEFRVYW
ncbi:MAG: hypothetical protein WD342_15440 [Verrucomicrobiales bacterium]